MSEKIIKPSQATFDNWLLCNQLLNMVRRASGLTLVSPNANPYKRVRKIREVLQ